MKNKIFRILTLSLFAVIIATLLVSCGDIGNLERGESDDLISALDEMNLSESGRYFIVAFPGLGREPILIAKDIGKLGNLTVTLSGIVSVIAVAVAVIYSYITMKKSNASLSSFVSVVVFGLLGGIIGGRVYYLLASFELYKTRPFLDIFKFWDGGMAIYGALIGGALAVATVCVVKKISVMKIYDAAIPPLLIGQVIGRFADFFSGSSYGLPMEEGSLLYAFRMGIYPNAFSDWSFAYVHPAFLYEVAWNLVGLVIVSIAFFKKKHFDGQVFFMYLTWYGFGRTFIEMIRADSLYIGSVRISLLLSCLAFFAGAALLIYGVIEGKKRKLATEDYESAYPLFKTKFTKDDTKNTEEKEK